MVWSTIYDHETRVVMCDNQESHVRLVDADSHLEQMCSLNVNSKANLLRLSGIICTIGPSSRDVPTLLKMMETGMNIARLNFSHGTHNYHYETITNIRAAVLQYGKTIGMKYPFGIAIDTKGPEIRTGLLEGDESVEIELKKGDTIILTTDGEYAEKGNKEKVYVDYANITNVVKPCDKIYVDDGLISLSVEAVESKDLVCKIENGGLLGNRKGVNLPGICVDLPAVSEKDKKDLVFAVDQGLDMVFASFIRNAAAVKKIREILGEKGKNVLIISKIENQEGLTNLDEIIAESDGIMVARGDLGIEIPPEKVFLAQKTIIARCNKVGKPVICATQMLDSMVKKPRPTRAEMSDIANAILDGADCVMLSSETAKGEYPVECVLTMANICKEAEAAIWHRKLLNDLSTYIKPPVEAAHSIAIAAVEASIKCLATAIIVITTSGKSAHLISKYRPFCPILAVTRNEIVARQCHLYRGIIPIQYTAEPLGDWLRDVDRRVHYALKLGKKDGFIKVGDPVIVVTGWRQGPGYTNTLRIVYVSEEEEEPIISC